MKYYVEIYLTDKQIREIGKIAGVSIVFCKEYGYFNPVIDKANYENAERRFDAAAKAAILRGVEELLKEEYYGKQE